MFSTKFVLPSGYLLWRNDNVATIIYFWAHLDLVLVISHQRACQSVNPQIPYQKIPIINHIEQNLYLFIKCLVCMQGNHEWLWITQSVSTSLKLETQLLGLNYSSALDRSVILLKFLNVSLFCSPYLCS